MILLILDQPTQVYYPVERDAGGSLDVLEDADCAAVKRLFRWLADRVEELSGSLQVVVMDQAELGEPWFDAAVVERWRDGDALIPGDWIVADRPGCGAGDAATGSPRLRATAFSNHEDSGPVRFHPPAFGT